MLDVRGTSNKMLQQSKNKKENFTSYNFCCTSVKNLIELFAISEDLNTAFK